MNGTKKTSTIDWLIRFIGDAGHRGIRWKNIISRGEAAGHHKGTLSMELGGADHYGYTELARPPRFGYKRLPLFRRVARGVYCLNDEGYARYLDLLQRKQHTHVVKVEFPGLMEGVTRVVETAAPRAPVPGVTRVVETPAHMKSKWNFAPHEVEFVVFTIPPSSRTAEDFAGLQPAGVEFSLDRAFCDAHYREFQPSQELCDWTGVDAADMTLLKEPNDHEYGGKDTLKLIVSFTTDGMGVDFERLRDIHQNACYLMDMFDMEPFRELNSAVIPYSGTRFKLVIVIPFEAGSRWIKPINRAVVSTCTGEEYTLLPIVM